jgi:hypothetical protein
MATIKATVTYAPNGQVGIAVIQWPLVTENDTCEAVELPAWADASVQIEGTFGGATAVLKGSNDGTNYQNLTDPQGNDISKTTADLEQVTEVVRYMKPTFSGGTSQLLTVTVVGRRTR